MALGNLSKITNDDPWKRSAFFSLMLVILEKIVEHDFVCPCDRVYTNVVFFYYLLIPTAFALGFGIYLLKSKVWKQSEGEESCCSCCKIPPKILKFLTLIVPPGIWVALFLSDGRYVSCYATKLTAEYSDSSDKPPWEWCSKIRNLTDDQNHVHNSFYWSKFAGFALILILIFILAAFSRDKKSDQQSNQAVAEVDTPLQQT